MKLFGRCVPDKTSLHLSIRTYHFKMALFPREYLVCLCLVLLLGYSFAEPKMPCGDNVQFKFIPDMDDCSVYYVCSEGISVKHVCPENEAFYGHMCVEKHSKYDICNQRRSQPFRQRISGRIGDQRNACLLGETGVYKHPFKCALYFNCDDPSESSGILHKKYLRECPTSTLFDEHTGRCLPDTQVDCGNRIKPEGKCDYIQNQGLTSHAQPCGMMVPSCEGLPDGNNAWPNREGSPLYVTCNAGQVVSKHMCQTIIDNSGLRTQTMFDQSSRLCQI